MTEFITHFHFLRPLFLLMLLPALAIGFLLLRSQMQAIQWQSVIAPHLLKYLVDGEANNLKRFPVYALIALWCLAVLALAGPAWKKLPEPVHKQASALVILWDLSPSMKAADLTPSRLVRSRLKLIDLLRSRHEGVTALIAYAGEAHVVTPLTDDTRTIVSLLSGLDPNIMPVTGSNPEMALELANQLLKDGGITKGDIVFITDGIAASAQPTLSDLARTGGHRITVWGIGTAEGAPIPGKNSGFLRNNAGEIVIAKLDERKLSEAAIAMGGAYVPFTNNDFDLKSVQSISESQTNKLDIEKTRTFDKWYEHGPYLLLFILPFAAFAFRRGWLLSVVMFAVLTSSDNASALSWDDLWLNKDQQAAKALQEGDSETAAKIFKDPDWKAIAEYKTQDYEAALDTFKNDTSAEGYLNQGNALAHLGDYDKATQAYDKALKINPEFEPAKQNKAIAEKLKKLAEEQQQSPQQDGQGQENSDQEKGKQQQNQQNQNNKGGDQNDQQSQQQNAQNQSQQGDNASQQDGESSENQESSGQQMTQEQKEALQQHYAQEDKQQSGEGENQDSEKDEEQSAAQSAEDEKEQSEKTEQNIAVANGEEGEQQDGEQNNESVALMRPAEEQTEEQQALEQWLRKVPDDPSGLLRNKFQYETQERRRETRSRRIRTPEQTEDRL